MRHTCAFVDEEEGGGGTGGAETATVAVEVESTAFKRGIGAVGMDEAVGAMKTFPTSDGRMR
jgi:hypothetical protein